LESGIKVVRGASFDKKEFKRNVAGSGAYAPTTTVLILSLYVQYTQLRGKPSSNCYHT
jgi:hypothetical protein